jgi:probable addiction module antidote protein
MKNPKAGISYNEWEIKGLRKDRGFALEYLKLALESLDDPEERGASLLMLRALAEAYGGLGVVAAQASISRESLYRALSPKGNPTLKTLIAVVNAMGLRLSVVEERQTKRKRPRSKAARKAA